MTLAQEDLDFLVEHEIATAVNDGFPPRNLDAWIKAVRRKHLEQEESRPGWIASVANGLRARENGQRVTGWREVRGTHGVSYDPDPAGTARPPWI